VKTGCSCRAGLKTGAGDDAAEKLARISADLRDVARIIENRQLRQQVGAEYVEAALEAQGRRLHVVDLAEVDDDLVRDVTEILTPLYGRRVAADRAARAVAAPTGDQP
jgi:predicted site-specific integrase-resolvase